jgi:hypothetical protein
MAGATGDALATVAAMLPPAGVIGWRAAGVIGWRAAEVALLPIFAAILS